MSLALVTVPVYPASKTKLAAGIGLEPIRLLIQSQACYPLHHPAIWLPSEDLNLDYPDPKSGVLPFRRLGKKW